MFLSQELKSKFHYLLQFFKIRLLGEISTNVQHATHAIEEVILEVL